MTLLSVMQSGLSALQASQTGLRVTSQNVANVDTVGYARVELSTSSRYIGDAGGVDVNGLRRAADRFLSAAVLSAESVLGAQAARSDLLDRAQASFGDPSDGTSTFALLNRAFATLTTAANDPSSSLQRARVMDDLNTLLNDISRVGADVAALRREADQRVGDAVGDANTLIVRIGDLNREIQTTINLGGDASNAENAQDQALNALSELLDIKVTQRPEGGVELRTAAGDLLVGETRSSLRFTPPTDPSRQVGALEILDAAGRPRPVEISGRGGTIGGLIQARDRDLPELADAIGNFAAQLADALNGVHNDSATVPAPTALAGRATGLAADDPLRFSGGVTIGLVRNGGPDVGVLDRRIEVDFANGGRLRVDGGAWTQIGAVGSELTLTQLSAALAPQGVQLSMDAATGAVSLSATGANQGVAVRQGAEGIEPSSRGGRGFAHFFGLNDLVSRPTPIFFETGFAAGDAGFPASGGGVTREIAFEVRDSSGRIVAQPRVAAPGGTIGDMISATRNALGGLATFTFDASTGALTMSPAAGYTIDVSRDTTERNGQSFSTLFGLGAAARANRATELSLKPRSTQELAFAQPNLAVAIGDRALEAGDGRGARALATLQETPRRIAAAGGLAASFETLGNYVAAVGGLAGRKAAEATSAAETADQVRAAALERRDTAQRVNLDEELTKMTQYQQSYAAAARVIQAAKEMMDTLLQIA